MPPRSALLVLGIATMRVECWLRRQQMARSMWWAILNTASVGERCAANVRLVTIGVWRDPGVRLTRPLKRAGPKGTGRFEPTSWDEAVGDIANRLSTIRSRHGAAAILHTHYTGTGSLIAGNFPLRFFNSIGATEVDPDTVCNKAGHVAS
jgi:anaerobic selenocysteine-containing dehydrogenase